MIYAQLNNYKKCIALLRAESDIKNNNYIMLNAWDESIIGKKYESGNWVEDLEPEPEPEGLAPVTQLDRLEASLDYLVMLNV